MLQREPAGTGNVFDTDQERNIGVSKRDALEIVVIRGHQIEECLTPGTIENHFTVACRFDDDRLFRRSALRQVVSAVKESSQREITWTGRSVHVMEPIADIEAGVDQDHVAGL